MMLQGLFSIPLPIIRLPYSSLFHSFLLQQKADYTLTNVDGDSALSLAKKGGYRNIADLLRSYGATI
jgi:ankyrin repeat protein